VAKDIQNLSNTKYQTPLMTGSTKASTAANSQLAPVIKVLQVIAMMMWPTV
jgi:hypothetical protein